MRYRLNAVLGAGQRTILSTADGEGLSAMLRRWAQRRYDKAQAEYWQSIEPVLELGERKIASAPARNLWDGPQDGVLFLTDRAIYWGAWLGQGRQTRPMFAQDLRECPHVHIGEHGTLDIAMGGEQVGSFASFAPAPGAQWGFAEFCKSFGQAMEESKKLPPATEAPPGDVR
ncbi:hypothetical protein ACFCYF_12540 [Streptomyces chartreusis]|uniref:hypothetical protein n=1 Tax=Streptomyces chartreusis TaxID=1969 RepID=UPI0035DC0D45